MSTSKRTIINADEELVIKGKLTVEGNVTQLEQTNVVTVTNLAGNVFTINSDASNTTAILTLNSNNSNASISYNYSTDKLSFNKPLALAANANLETTGNVVAGWFRGDGSNITGLSTTIVAEGTNLYFTTARARGNISVTDAGGDGALYYSNANGVITYVGPSASETRAHFSAANGVVYSSSTGEFSLDSNTAGNGLVYSNGVLSVGQGDGVTVNVNDIAVDSTVVRTSGDQEIYGVKQFESGIILAANINITPETNNTSSIGNSTNWIKEIYSNVIHVAHLNFGDDANLQDIHTTFYTGTAANALVTRTSDGLTYTHNTTGAYYKINVGDGLQVDSNANLAVDSTVIRSVGDQTITGNLTIAGQLNYQNVVDSYVTDTNITLNANAVVNNDARIIVNRPANVNVDIKWNESTKRWQFTNNGTTYVNILELADLDDGNGLILDGNGALAVGQGDGIIVNAANVSVDSTVVRTSSNQSISGVKSFTGELSIPTTMAAADNTIFIVGTAVYAKVSGNVLQLTADSDIGQVEDVGATGANVYAGYRSVTVGNSMVFYHGIKSIDAGSYLNISEASNVITIAGNASGIRGLISSTGNINYNSTTGVISESLTTTDIDEGNNLYFTAARARGNISGTGLISYDSANGVISTTADNYSSWSVQTGSGAGAKAAISSGHTLILSGGSGIAVTNSGNTVTIAMTETGDISAVAAGDGLTGGGVSGDVTLNVAAGDGIIVNPDNVAINVAYVRNQFSATSPLSYNASTGVFSITEVGDIESVTAGAGLTGGGTSGNVTLNIGAGTGITVNADDIAVNSTYINSLIDSRVAGGDGLTYTSGTLAVGAGAGITVNADNVALTSNIIASGAKTYGTASQVPAITVDTYGRVTSISNTSISITASQVSDFTSVANTAIDNRIIGGSGLTYSSGTLAVGAGNYVTVGADTVSVDATSTNTASKVVARDASGNFAANVITATATSAQYADLAENYLADTDYLPGTVLVFGGDAEVTGTGVYESTRVAGVVTTQPAHVMNSGLQGNHIACIALRGRVPVRVRGIVRKGDVLVTAGEGHIGYAVASLNPRDVPAAAIIGKAITDKFDVEPGVVEALI